MDIQNLIVALIVAPSLVYAVWSIMPVSWRGACARGLLKAQGGSARRYPARLEQWLARTAAGNSGCGCSGCDNNPAARSVGKPGASAAPAGAAQDVQVVRFHPRPRR